MCSGSSTRYGGEEVPNFPNQIEVLAQCEPVYETMPGWKSDISHVKRFGDLPANAQAYVRRIAALVGASVSHVLVGKQRDQSIVV
jgi:adenylosuccinate synthase